ncbi:MAG: MATE family efflux transporter [Steroidobacteraceae bacterium]
MKDLTKGSITRHLLEMAAPIAAGMIVQTLYFLVDLYFVARLGDAAIAGVGAAGSVMFIVVALTQMLGAGAVALIAQAAGRRDRQDANLVFNQSLVLAGLLTVVTLVAGYALAGAYVRRLGADAATATAGLDYLRWYMPGLALQFALIAMGSALRGTGIVRPTMVVQMLSVVVNAILAPILIAGWGTGRPLGVAGAGLASSIAVAAGVAWLFYYFVRLEKYVAFHRELLRPRLRVWWRLLDIGLPAGGEFALMFLYMAIVYGIIRDFGAAAQAGFGMGSRVMQAISLPAMAIAFATAPVAGQNFGAGHGARVRATFRTAIALGATLMLVLTLLCQIAPAVLLRGFTQDAAVIGVGTQFLQIVSWNFAASGIVFTCSGLFQALGNTWPTLLSSAARLLTFALPATWLAAQPHFAIAEVWYLSVASVTLQAVLSYALARRQLALRLRAAPADPHC